RHAAPVRGLRPHDRVDLAVESAELGPVDPVLLDELELSLQIGVETQEEEPALAACVPALLPVEPTAADQPMPVHEALGLLGRDAHARIREGIPWIDAADVRAH